MRAFDPPVIETEEELARFQRKSRLAYGIGVFLCISAGLLLAYLDDNTRHRARASPSS